MRSGAIDLPDLAATMNVGGTLADAARVGDVIGLEGPLGAGKTSLVRGMLAKLGFTEDVQSPSYPIVITYDPPEIRLPVWHVDLYRIADPADIAELGLEEARNHAILVVEWPEKLHDASWSDALRLQIAPIEAARRLTWTAPAAWDGRWPPPR